MSQERRPVTVLFADVQGFSTLSERLDAEQVADAMNSCLSALAQIVERYGGHVDKYMGDEIMALFGAPIAHEDDPVRAVRAALAMRQSLDEQAPQMQAQLGQRLNMRIGVNSGIVIAGTIGAAGTEQYTVLDDAVNVASRLESQAAVGTVLVGEDTYRQATWAFRWREPRRLQVKGRTEPVVAYEALEEIPGATAPRGVSALPTPFTGREEELAALQRSWRACLEHGPQFVSITGEAGVGKSRLVAEFELSLQQDGGVRFVRGNTEPVGDQPYSPIIGVLQALGGGSDGLPGDLAALISKSESAPPESKGALQRQVAAALEAEARRAPLAVVLEDLHWADSATLELIEALAKQLRDVPLLLVLVSRPWQQRPLARDRRSPVIELQPLSSDDARRLTDLLLGSPHVPEALRQRVVAQAEGNPYYLEEAVRSLVESGVLRYEDDQWVCTAPPDELPVPESLRAVILARLDQLEGGPRDLIRDASVLNRPFSLALLHAFSRDGVELQADLTALVDAGLLQTQASSEGQVFTFRHALVREVAYETLVRRQRTELHQRAAQALEQLHRSRLPIFAETLAYHYEQAGVEERAAHYYLLASERAEEVHASVEARQYRDAARRLLGMASVWSLYAGAERLSPALRAGAWLTQVALAVGCALPLLALLMSQEPPSNRITLGLPLAIMSFSPSAMALATIIGAAPLLLMTLGLNQLVVPALLRGTTSRREHVARIGLAWAASLGAVALVLAALGVGLRFGLLSETLESFTGAAVLELLRGDPKLIATLLLGTLVPAAAWAVWVQAESARWRRRLATAPAEREAGAGAVVLGLVRFAGVAAGLSLLLLVLYVFKVLPGSGERPELNGPLFAFAAAGFAAACAAAVGALLWLRRRGGAGTATLGLELPLIASLLFGVVLAVTLRQDVVAIANGLFGPGESAVLDRATALFPDLAPAHYLKGERLWFEALAQPIPDDPGETGALQAPLDALTRAIEADPSYAPAYLARGKIRSILGDTDGALADAERLIELKPEHPAGYALRADVYNVLGQPERAADDFAIATRPLPPSLQAWDALFVRCVALSAASRQGGPAEWRDEAIGDCERSLELNEHHASTYDELGLLYFDAGRYEDAFDVFDRFARVSRGPRTLGNRALALMRLGRYEEALVDLNEALDLEPRYALAHNQRAETQLYLDDTEVALADAAEAVELRPADLENHLTRAVVAMYTGRLALALSSAEQLETLGADEALVRNVRGYAYALAGDYERALPELDRAVRLAPDSASALDSRAYARYLAGEYRGALADVDRALELVPAADRSSRSEYLYHRALVRAALGDRAGAEADAQEAQTLRPLPLIARGLQELIDRLGRQR